MSRFEELMREYGLEEYKTINQLEADRDYLENELCNPMERILREAREALEDDEEEATRKYEAILKKAEELQKELMTISDYDEDVYQGLEDTIDAIRYM